MDVLGWIWWLIVKVIGIAWAVAWFLVGGWVVTLAQIGVIALVIFGYKYGWRRAPQEIMARGGALLRYGWQWVRARDGQPVRVEVREREVTRVVHRSRPGDVNVSTLLSLLMLAGLAAVAVVR